MLKLHNQNMSKLGNNVKNTEKHTKRWQWKLINEDYMSATNEIQSF